MATSGYFGTQSTANRKQQATNAAAIGDQNNVTPQVQPNKVQAGGFDPSSFAAPPSGIVANPGETPQQTAARYVSDYHSPDAASVTQSALNWANGITPPVNGDGSPNSGGGSSSGGFGGPMPNISGLLGKYQQTFKPAQLPTAGLQTYNPSQLMSPQGQQNEGGIMSLLQQALGHPDVMSQQDVGILNEQQKAAALGQQQATQQALGDQQAGLGRFGSGYQQSQTRRMGDATQANILGAYHTNQLAADQANATNRLNVMNTGNSVLNEAVGRGQAQAAENQMGVSSQNDATKYNLQQALAQQGVNQEGNQLALQGALGEAGSGLGYLQANNSNNNFMSDLLARLNMFNTSQKNATY